MKGEGRERAEDEEEEILEDNGLLCEAANVGSRGGNISWVLEERGGG